MKYPKIYSEGTLRVSDLLSAYFSALEDVNPQEHEKYLKDKEFMEYLNSDESFFDDPDRLQVASDILIELEHKINESLPDGYLFGSHLGDPACIGIFSFETSGE